MDTIGTKEEFRDVSGHEGAYTISNTGKVYSVKSNKILTIKPKNDGYYQTCLNGRWYYIHRLVATAFINNKHEKQEVNHIDGNRANNTYTNLEWASKNENVKHSFDHGCKTMKGENNSQSKLTTEDVFKIKTHIKNKTMSYKDIAKTFGIRYDYAKKFKTNKVWPHIVI